MEEKNTVEIEETTTAVQKESKVKSVLGTIGSGIKRNWKTVAVGAGALIAGIVIGSRSASTEDTIEDFEAGDSEVEETESETL